MFKMLKYLKPYGISVTMIVILVFAQVQGELALPEYMANIVSDGIVNGGITDSAMVAISEEKFDIVMQFVEDDDKELVKSSYDLVLKNETININNQNIIIEENVYVLNNEDTQKVSDALVKAIIMTDVITNKDALELMGVDPNVDILMMLEMDTTLSKKLLEKFNEESGALSGENLNSASFKMIKAEYQNIGIDTDKIQTSYIFLEGFYMLLIAMFAGIAAIGVAFLSSRVAAKVARNLRLEVFSKVESFSNVEFSRFSTASLITRTTNDVQQVQQVLTMMMRIMLYAPLMGIGAIFKVIEYPSMLWILGLVLSIILVLLITTFAITLPKFKIIQKLIDKLNLVMREFLDGMLVIRAFNTQKNQEDNFEKANNDITKVNLFVNRVMSCVMPIMFFLMSSVSILIIWEASKQIDIGAMQIGDMMAFLQYAMSILMSFIMVSMISIMIPRSSVSAQRILEVINCEVSIKDENNLQPFNEKVTSITFKDVFFKYPKAEEYVLSNLNIKVKSGDTIAFIGSTGSGKSTLVNLIPRFYDISSGEIYLNKTKISDIPLHTLREKIGYVPQKAVLFSGDIESNLKYADQNASEKMIADALRVSQSNEFISKMGDGLNSSIAQGGTNVSGGQKQRLSIARAIVKDPEIYIFDDSFSALDYKTDSLVRNELSNFVKDKKSILLIVAQRVSSIMHSDNIVVLDNGVIVGQGTHDELMKTCEVYNEIASSQLSQKELNNE